MTDEVGVRQKTQVATPAELAAAREARGMSQLDISQRIKLQVKQVNALEEGQWEALPGRSFVRGALRSYGKFLDVDVAPLLESIGGFAEPSQVQGMQPLDASISRSSGLGLNGGGRGSPILWVIAGLIGVVALVLYFGSDEDSSRIRSWLPSGEAPSNAPAAPAPGSTPSSDSPAPAGSDGASTVGSSFGSSVGGAPTASSAGGAAPTASGSGSSQPPAIGDLQVLPQNAPSAPSPLAMADASGPTPSGLTPSGATPSGATPSSVASTLSPASPASAPAVPPAGGAAGSSFGSAAPAASPTTASPGKDAQAAAAGAGAAAADASAPAAAADAKGVMKVRAAEDAWVEVRQADGSALHNGLVKAGASIELKGNPPYRLVLGNASRIELSYEGKAQDLAPHIRANNIARLQLR